MTGNRKKAKVYSRVLVVSPRHISSPDGSHNRFTTGTPSHPASLPSLTELFVSTLCLLVHGWIRAPFCQNPPPRRRQPGTNISNNPSLRHHPSSLLPHLLRQPSLEGTTYINMGRSKMDEAAAARIRKARGEKVGIALTQPWERASTTPAANSRGRTTLPGERPWQPAQIKKTRPRARPKAPSRVGKRMATGAANRAAMEAALSNLESRRGTGLASLGVSLVSCQGPSPKAKAALCLPAV